MLQEVGSKLDLKRVHFLGLIDYHAYLNLLQVSSVHVYLTYPFVLSWSFVEAMACGCLIVGSATPLCSRFLRDGSNGLTVGFFGHSSSQPHRVSTRSTSRVAAPARRGRATALEQFDLNRLLLPRWTALFDDLLNHRRPAGGAA